MDKDAMTTEGKRWYRIHRVTMDGWNFVAPDGLQIGPFPDPEKMDLILREIHALEAQAARGALADRMRSYIEAKSLGKHVPAEETACQLWLKDYDALKASEAVQ